VSASIWPTRSPRFRIVVEHFENHRSEYPLEQFDLRQLLQNLTDALDRDVNTSVEHENLDMAAKSLGPSSGVPRPRRFPELCTDHVLAMEFINGGKIVKALPEPPTPRGCF
jgi:predicted unusual protein kinase regulating ubiquinone biosynthesis (AarF/ABC1/UbiB family)